MEGRSGGSFEELKGGDYLALGSSVTVDTNAFWIFFLIDFKFCCFISLATLHKAICFWRTFICSISIGEVFRQ